jgi:ubiquitin fusion degradation protein 1
MTYKSKLICFSYNCSSQPDHVVSQVRYSNKILLPEETLRSLMKKKYNPPFFFKIENIDMKYGQVCGIQEFSAPPGVVHLPYHIMESIGISEGQHVEIKLASPVKGTYIKIQPHTTSFINLSNPKALLEKVLSEKYPVLTEGHTIAIEYLNKVFYIDIVKTEPAPVIDILNVNLNVDFDKPFDYQETQIKEQNMDIEDIKNNENDTLIHPKPIISKNNVKKYKKTITYDMQKFPGTGNRLGGK